MKSFIGQCVLALGMGALCMHAACAQTTEPAGTAGTAAAAASDSTPRPAKNLPNPNADRDQIFESVKVLERPYFRAPSVMGLGGAIAGIAFSGVYKDEPERIAAFIKQENIDIAGIVRNEFLRQFALNPRANEVFRNKGPGKLQAEVTYGIVGVPHLQDGYRPYLSIRMAFRDSSGLEKWNDREYVSLFGDATAIPYVDYFKSSKNFTAEMEMAANEVVKLLLRDFMR